MRVQTPKIKMLLKGMGVIPLYSHTLSLTLTMCLNHAMPWSLSLLISIVLL
jgi:hypothetical protein